MTEETQATEEVRPAEKAVSAQPAFAFAGGDDVTIPSIPDAVGAKVIDQAVGEDGLPRYKVAYGRQEWFAEGQLAALA